MIFNQLFKKPYFEPSGDSLNRIVEFYAQRSYEGEGSLKYEEMLVSVLHHEIFMDSYKNLVKQKMYAFNLKEHKPKIEFDLKKINVERFRKHLKNYFYLGSKDRYLFNIKENNLSKIVLELIEIIESAP